MSAGFRLPPCVDDGAAFFTNNIVIPYPGFVIDWLANRAENAQAFAAGFFDEIIAGTDEGTDGGRRSIENIDFMFVDHLPEARPVWIIRHTFEHKGCRAVG